MTRQEFRELFHTALHEAAKNAEQQLSQPVPHKFIIQLHGAGYHGNLLDSAEAVDNIYLDENRFYRMIDVSVIEVDKDHCVVFVRVSAHQPGTFDQTWNSPPGSGPFKQLRAQHIKVMV